jgi:hypothetical protein
MKREDELDQLFDSLRKISFYVGHGKYNEYMSTEEVIEIKEKLQKILDFERKYEKANTDEEKELIYKNVSKYKTYNIKDFINHKLEDI